MCVGLEGSNLERKDIMTSLITIRREMAVLAALGLLALATIPVQAAPGDGVVHSATGSGQLHVTVDTKLRTVGFSAVMLADGTVTGYAEAQPRQEGNRWRIDVNCLNVVGNVALITGRTIYNQIAPEIVGWTGGFAVEDNGEGAGAPPDRITQGFFGPDLGEVEPGTVDCNDFGPADAEPFFWTVEHGNLMVR
jgi:hypothetical protein